MSNKMNVHPGGKRRHLCNNHSHNKTNTKHGRPGPRGSCRRWYTCVTPAQKQDNPSAGNESCVAERESVLWMGLSERADARGKGCGKCKECLELQAKTPRREAGCRGGGIMGTEASTHEQRRYRTGSCTRKSSEPVSNGAVVPVLSVAGDCANKKTKVITVC